MMIRLFSMFSGYGGAEHALKKANIDYEIIGYSEIKKHAIKCYNKNFPNTKNFGDCAKIKAEEIPDFDLLTGGFPCQDVSNAGNRDLSKGRTNLYNEIIRIIHIKKPRYLLLENVKGLLSMDLNEEEKMEDKLINKIVRDLKKEGYGVIYKCLNSKNYGIPQNRERIWFVCKLEGWNFMEFMFPEPKKLMIFLKDILEENIDEKYYLTEKQINKIINRNRYGDILMNEEQKHSNTLTCVSTNYISPTKIDKNILNQKTRDIEKAINISQEIADKEQKPVQIDLYHLQHGEIRPLTTYIPQELDINRCLQTSQNNILIMPKKIDKKEEIKIYDNYNHKLKEDGTIGTLSTHCGSTVNAGSFTIITEEKDNEKQKNFKGDCICSEVMSTLVCGITHNDVIKEPTNKIIKTQFGKHQQDAFYDSNGIMASLVKGTHDSMPHFTKTLLPNGKLRRLTPKECFRLMGFLKDEIDITEISDNQAYDLAGDGWDINIVSQILKKMFPKEIKEKNEMESENI